MKFQRANRVIMGAGSQNFRALYKQGLLGLTWEMRSNHSKLYSYDLPVSTSFMGKHVYILQWQWGRHLYAIPVYIHSDEESSSPSFQGAAYKVDH